MTTATNEIGKSIPRQDGVEKVTGEAIFTTGIVRPNMLHAKVLRSPLPHARIVSIDTARAKKAPGVRGVYTASDILQGLNCELRYGGVFQDQPMLALDKVCHVGEPVVAVVAEEVGAAEDALDIIGVEYEELTPVLDVYEAMADGAPLVHEQIGIGGQYQVMFEFNAIPGTNICNQHTITIGDIEAGFAASDYIFEGTYSSPPTQHCCMEPHATVAEWVNDGVSVWTSAQAPYAVKMRLAPMFKLQPEQVRVVVHHVGGGYGGKSNMKLEPLTAALAKLSGRPVKYVLTRKEEYFQTSKHGVEYYLKTGVSKDGALLSRYSKVMYDTGAYAETGPIVSMKSGYTASGPYAVPNIVIDIFCVYTNKTPAGSLRGLGVPQVAWGHETQMDEIAVKLGIDPLELRLKHAYPDKGRFVSGENLRHFHVIEALEDVAQASGWSSRPKGSARAGDGGRFARGMGLACTMKNSAMPTRSEARIWLGPDGDAEVRSATVEIGQGSSTVLLQLAADSLGLPFERVRLALLDTDVVPYDVGTISDRSTFHMGNAIVAASEELKRQLKEHASAELEAAPADLSIEGDRISVAGAPERNMTFAEVVRKAAPQDGLLAFGAYATRSRLSSDVEQKGEWSSPFWDVAAAVAEVEVDRLNGKVRVLRYFCATDAGRAINPALCRQQLHGEILMGLGMTLHEEMRFENGQLLNPSYVDYKIPSVKDVIGSMDIVLRESRHPDGPFGAKGIGEVAVPQVSPAVANAIYDAVGVRFHRLPITPERVLQALREQAEPNA